MEQRHVISVDVGQPGVVGWKGEPALSQVAADVFSEAEWLPVRSLLPADSPRQAGEDIEHTRVLAKIDARLPPILVHRSTIRVIDGIHRLGAAPLLGDEMIEVQFFDGIEQEAFVLGVRANIAHGLPLSLVDRTRAAERIIASHPTWSDRAIASTAGLCARTIGNIRRRIKVETDLGDVRARTGRDGRVRPLDSAEGRRRALAIIKERPEASLREIAREAGVSPSTVRDVRRRVQRGDDAVLQVRRSRNDKQATEPGGDALPDGPALASMLQGLQSDPSLRFTEPDRTVLRWIFSRAIRADERLDVVGKVPPHCTYIIANVARACADEWLQLANELEERGTHLA